MQPLSSSASFSFIITFKFTCLLFRMQAEYRPDLFFDCIWIAEINTVRQTNIISTGRDQSPVHPMVTKVALLGDAFIMVKVNGIIGASFDT